MSTSTSPTPEAAAGTPVVAAAAEATGERGDLLQALADARAFLRLTVRGLTDEQVRVRTTVSELCLGGVLKHVTAQEASWVGFVVGGAGAMPSSQEGWTPQDWAAEFQVLPGETLAVLLERYEEVARRTDEVVRTLPDLDAAHPLPEAPWFPPGARWSARRALLHVVAETAQHAGHADVLRESLDGAKSMG